MSHITRALLDEADGVEPSAEPPNGYSEPLQEGEAVLEMVPRDIRQQITLARMKNDRALELADGYEEADDPRGAKLVEIYRLSIAAQQLESSAHDEIAQKYAGKTKGLGTLSIRVGWMLAWSPMIIEEDEEGQVEMEAQKQIFNS
jgi:hypothetical protein